uniref:Putative secreted protein n=1 Tax=Ixodes ricinus TaxID=34613 RepID=A0A6B0UJI1_IXORI
MQLSMMQRRMPQALSMFRLIWSANSLGLNCCVPRMACFDESRTCRRLTYPNLIWSEPASRAWTVHLASLHELFLSSLASTAPRWVSSFWRQSMPPEKRGSHSFRAFTLTN